MDRGGSEDEHGDNDASSGDDNKLKNVKCFIKEVNNNNEGEVREGPSKCLIRTDHHTQNKTRYSRFAY